MTMPFEPISIKDARKWAATRFKELLKCPGCNGIMPDDPEQFWTADDWSGENYCSERCADREAEYQAHFEAETLAAEADAAEAKADSEEIDNDIE